MGRVPVAHVVAVPRFQSQLCTAFEFDLQRTTEAKKNVSLGAPMIGNVTGGVFNHPNPDLSKALGAPNRDSAFPRMF
jgi:hypothetical protein